MYLLKYIAKSGICSRRKAADLIKSGSVLVNDVVVANQFLEVGPDDVVTYKGKVVKPEAHVYVLLNKPKDYLTTCSDERGRKTVMELIRDASDHRLYPVGRLDRMTTGLLLFTNDGELAQKLSHPSSNIGKVYRVLIDRPLKSYDYKKLLDGLELEDGFIKVDSIKYTDSRDRRDVSVEIHSGRYRIVRRMFYFLGYKVEKLDRVGYAGLSLKSLKRGEWRFLTKEEVNRLNAL